MLRRPDAVDRSRDAALEGMEGVAPLPSKDTARSLGSRAAQQADHAFMERLRGQHMAAKLAGIVARMRHCGPPVRFMGRGMCEPIGTGPADFQGQFTRAYGSKSIAAEAKSRAGRLAFNDIPAHQVEDLDACADEGGCALLLYEHRDGSRVTPYAIPWRRVPWVTLRTAKSIGPEECAGWEFWPCYLQRFARAS